MRSATVGARLARTSACPGAGGRRSLLGCLRGARDRRGQPRANRSRGRLARRTPRVRPGARAAPRPARSTPSAPGAPRCLAGVPRARSTTANGPSGRTGGSASVTARTRKSSASVSVDSASRTARGEAGAPARRQKSETATATGVGTSSGWRLRSQDAMKGSDETSSIPGRAPRSVSMTPEHNLSRGADSQVDAPSVGGLPLGPGLGVALYVLLVASAGLAFFGRSFPGTAPHPPGAGHPLGLRRLRRVLRGLPVRPGQRP